MTLQPGTTLGRYQILEPLGSGGMATVYKAYEPSLDRVVALKIIRPGLAGEPDFVARFRREAQAVARLAHPNIVQVFGFDEIDGLLFLAMQYLEGGTLKDRLAALAARERLPWPEVARIVADVAEALGYAHEQGIVHRDVKPSNVMLTGKGRSVVTDFGIARILGSAAMTQTGVGIGTPEYMAPEQGQGAHVDERADIYALGVVAYELLCGRVPFVADTPFAVVAAHMRDPLPLPRALAPDLSEATERVLLKALAKDPNQRFATAPELASALGDAFAGNATLPPITSRPRVRALAMPRPALVAAALAFVAAVSGGIVLSGAFGGRTTPSEKLSPATSAQGAGATSGTATPAVATASPSAVTPSPSPPPHAIPSKGPLFFQAKLDGTNADVSSWSADLGNPGDTEIHYLPGAIELSVKPSGPSSPGGNAQLNMPARTAYVAELDLAATTTATVGPYFIWTFRQCATNGQVQLIVYPGEQTMEVVDAFGPNKGRDHLTTLIPIPLKDGSPHTIAVVLTSTNLSLYLDEKPVADAPYTRCMNSSRAVLAIGTDAGISRASALVRITGARFYGLPG